MRTAMDEFMRPAAPIEELPLFAAPPAPPPAKRPQDHAPRGGLTAAQHEAVRALVPIARALMRTGGAAKRPGTLRSWEVLLEGMARGVLPRPVPQAFTRRMSWFMREACGFRARAETERVPAEHFPEKHGNHCTVWDAPMGGAR